MHSCASCEEGFGILERTARAYPHLCRTLLHPHCFATSTWNRTTFLMRSSHHHPGSIRTLASGPVQRRQMNPLLMPNEKVEIVRLPLLSRRCAGRLGKGLSKMVVIASPTKHYCRKRGFTETPIRIKARATAGTTVGGALSALATE